MLTVWIRAANVPVGTRPDEPGPQRGRRAKGADRMAQTIRFIGADGENMPVDHRFGVLYRERIANQRAARRAARENAERKAHNPALAEAVSIILDMPTTD